jgi:5-methylcytosine-specific restriction endonuclease McrA
MCTAKLFPGNCEYDHGIPYGLSSNSDLGNCVPLCRACHRTKTAKDITKIAKAERMKRFHLGAKAPGRRVLPFGRASKWKRKLTGGVVLR